MTMKHINLNPQSPKAPLRSRDKGQPTPHALPDAKEIKVHPSKEGGEDASIFFVGTATTIIEWKGLRVMTDVQFNSQMLPRSPGVTGTRKTNPAIDLHDLPPIDCVLLSHYHADHFDQDVEASLRRDLPIITTPHAKTHLEGKGPGEAFQDVHALDFFESLIVDFAGGDNQPKKPAIKVTGMPGKHVPNGVLGAANDFLHAVPPTNGWMVELGRGARDSTDTNWECGYRQVVNCVNELKEIPERYKGQNIDLMLVHLGGTTIPSPSLPLLMVTMDAKQGLELVQLINPDLTIPVHYDDYDVFLSPLADFKKVMDEAGLSDKVVYLDRKDQYKFKVS
ncbi:hypothetical protein MMC20_004668 [Loxospora ochrophaea]|nr:hypothetical protein [Loxospora ochrophaea]